MFVFFNIVDDDVLDTDDDGENSTDKGACDFENTPKGNEGDNGLIIIIIIIIIIIT